MTKEIYDGFKKEFEDLVSYDELNHFFEIYSIEEEDFYLRDIRRKITERFDKFTKIVESLLQPDAVISDMQECHVFSDSEKSKMYEMYKKMMYVSRLSYLVALDESEEDSVKFISESFEIWKGIQEQLKDILLKLKDSWKKDSSISEVLNYMG